MTRIISFHRRKPRELSPAIIVGYELVRGLTIVVLIVAFALICGMVFGKGV